MLTAVATTVYTDGTCSGNPGPGGWAWAVPAGEYRSGAEAATTNQRMEIQAALEAVTSLSGPLEVVSDSTYVVNCFRDRWWERWVEKGWVNSQRKPVANRDLWEPLVAAVQADPRRGGLSWGQGAGKEPRERLGAEAALDAGVPFVGVVAFPDQQSVWPAESQRRYESLLRKARDVITLQQKRPESKQAAGGALARRDAWLARNAHEALAVWD